jgi:hypothetical protein
VKFDEFVEDQTYRGLKKVMFNNSAQDSTYLAEMLATQLFDDAGVPAARVTHARVRLNGRDLGLYVVIEAMNKDFLKRHFGSGKGNLYEGYLQDVNGRLEQDNGEDETRADLQALNEACTIQDPTERWERLNEILDVDRFLSFIAMELLTTHWDGYLIHINNYRLYHDPKTEKMVFITHGLDWAFRRPNVSLDPPLKSAVARAVLTTQQGQEGYQDPQFICDRVQAAGHHRSHGAGAREDSWRRIAESRPCTAGAARSHYARPHSTARDSCCRAVTWGEAEDHGIRRERLRLSRDLAGRAGSGRCHGRSGEIS